MNNVSLQCHYLGRFLQSSCGNVPVHYALMVTKYLLAHV
jgi:hypothetical protein